MIYQKAFKPVVDFLFAFFFLILASPVIIFLVVLLAIINKGNPFFTQLRPGLKGRIFKIIKFKTMNDRKDSEGNLLPDGVRLTNVGNAIRKLSLDELPQLFNVVKGDMSIVGPRPLLPHYLDLYTPTQSRRHEVKPGITGWAQVNGRNAITWEEKFEKDVWYVNRQSFLLDLKIILKTIKKVIIRDGINSEGEATTTRFKGNI